MPEAIEQQTGGKVEASKQALRSVKAIPVGRWMNVGRHPLARAWLVVGILWVVAGLNYLDRVMITTMRTSLTEAIPMSDAQFGLLTSVFLWVYGLLSPLAGFLADRFSRSRVILASLFVWSAVTWLTGHTHTFNQLLVARALMGVSEACYIPAALALIMDYHPGGTRSLANGIHLSGTMIGGAMGGLGGWLAERHQWGYPFSLLGLFGILYAALLWFVLRDAPALGSVPSPAAGEGFVPTRARSSHPDGATPVNLITAIKSLLGERSFLLALALWGLVGLTGWVMIGWAPTYLGEHFKLAQGAAGFVASGYLQVAGLAGVLFGGAWADLWSRTNERSRIFVPAIGLCLAVPGLFLLAHGSVLSMAIAGLVLYGFGRYFTDANLMPILCLFTEARYRATGYGLLNLVGCIVGGVGIYAGGVLRDANFHLSLLFQLAAGGLVVCIALLMLMKPAEQPAGGEWVRTGLAAIAGREKGEGRA